MDITSIQRFSQQQLTDQFKREPTALVSLNALSNDWIATHPEEIKKTVLALNQANPRGWPEQVKGLLERIHFAAMGTLQPERGEHSAIRYFFKRLIFAVKRALFYSNQWKAFSKELNARAPELQSQEAIDAWVILGARDTNLFVEALKKLDLPDDAFYTLLEKYAKAAGIEASQIPGTILLLASPFHPGLVRKCLEQKIDDKVLEEAFLRSVDADQVAVATMIGPSPEKLSTPLNVNAHSDEMRLALIKIGFFFPTGHTIQPINAETIELALLCYDGSNPTPFLEAASQLPLEKLYEIKEILKRQIRRTDIIHAKVALNLCEEALFQKESYRQIAEKMKGKTAQELWNAIYSEYSSLYVNPYEIAFRLKHKDLAKIALQSVSLPIPEVKEWLDREFVKDVFNILVMGDGSERIRKLSTEEIRQLKKEFSDWEHAVILCEKELLRRETYKEIAQKMQEQPIKELADALQEEYKTLHVDFLTLALKTLRKEKLAHYYIEQGSRFQQEYEILTEGHPFQPRIRFATGETLLLSSGALVYSLVSKNFFKIVDRPDDWLQWFHATLSQDNYVGALTLLLVPFPKNKNIHATLGSIILRAIQENNRATLQIYLDNKGDITEKMLLHAIQHSEAMARFLLQRVPVVSEKCVRAAFEKGLLDLTYEILRKTVCPPDLVRNPAFITFLLQKKSLEQIAFLLNSVEFAYRNGLADAVVELMEKGTPYPPELKEEIEAFLRVNWRSPVASLIIELLLGDEKKAIQTLEEKPIEDLEKILAEYPREFPKLSSIINNILISKYCDAYVVAEDHFKQLPALEIPTAPEERDVNQLVQLYDQILVSKDLNEKIFPEGPAGPAYTRRALQGNFHDLIRFAATEQLAAHMDNVALPGGPQRRDWFKQYRNLLRLILGELVAKNNPELTDACLTQLALSKNVCASGRMQQALSVYETLNPAVATTLKDQVFLILKGLRSELLDFLAGQDVHAQEEWRRVIGKERGVMGADIVQEMHQYPLDQKKALSAFDSVYTPKRIFERVHAKIKATEDAAHWIFEHPGEKYRGMPVNDIWSAIADQSGALTVGATFSLMEQMGLLRKTQAGQKGTPSLQLLIDSVLTLSLTIEGLSDEEANFQIAMWLSAHREYQSRLNAFLIASQRPSDAIKRFLAALREKA